MSIDIRMMEAAIIEPEEANVDILMDNLEGHDTQKGYVPVLIFLVIGMFLQLAGNAYCVLAGTLICVGVCGLICIWVWVSAVFSRNEWDSLSGQSLSS